MRDVIPVRTTIMRCGTSKGIFINENHLPQDKAIRDKVILSIFGSPDKRQIDGIGGADVLTSKLALIAAPSREDADVDYTFGQVDIETPTIFYSGLCGNISSGIGTYAIEEGLVRAQDGITKVRVHSVNTQQVYTIEVPVHDGMPCVMGDYAIAGVPGTAARVTLDMVGTISSFRRGLFPTGEVKDVIEVPGLGMIEVSVVDVVNPCGFIKASAIGLPGDATTKDLTDDHHRYIDIIRSKIAKLIGIEGWDDKMPRDTMPFVAFVSEAKDYKNTLADETISGADVDFLSRVYFLGGIHATYPGSISCVTGACAKLPGTVLNEASKNEVDGIVRIGHPAGIIEVEAVAGKDEAGADTITRVTYSRTTRRLMDGYAYVPRTVFE